MASALRRNDAKVRSLPKGGGKPKSGPKKAKEPTTIRHETHRTVRHEYISDEGARRETISHREAERRRSGGMGEVRRRTTQRQRTDQQVRGAREKGDIKVANARELARIRAENRPQGETGTGSILAGIFRVLAVIIILAMLYLVLSNASSASGLIGGFGKGLYGFTNSTDPLFKQKGSPGSVSAFNNDTILAGAQQQIDARVAKESKAPAPTNLWDWIRLHILPAGF